MIFLIIENLSFFFQALVEIFQHFNGFFEILIGFFKLAIFFPELIWHWFGSAPVLLFLIVQVDLA